MAKHREDRPKGVVGETDPQKILKETQRVQAEENKAQERLAQERLNKK